MHMIAKLVVSLLVAAAAFALASTLSLTAGPLLFAAFCAATVITALLVSLPLPSAQSANPQPARRDGGRSTATAPRGQGAPVTSGPRETGQVKWFNGTKGFGFITRDDGQEIFVHFRSIRGQGRRGLRDGQRVSFVVTQTEKGPQAEDVSPEE